MSGKSTFRSQLFLLRVWDHPYGQSETHVRVQVRHVVTGETHNFRGWPDVVAYLSTSMLTLADDSTCNEDPCG